MYIVRVHLCVDAASYCTFNKANTCHLFLHAYIRKACPLLFVCRHVPVKLSWLQTTFRSKHAGFSYLARFSVPL